MKREERSKWIAALTLKGFYKQGKHFLRNEKDEFCCLGVLCDINKVDWATEEGKSNGPFFALHTIEDAIGTKTTLSLSKRVIPSSLLEKLGLQRADPVIHLTEENYKHLRGLGFNLKYPEYTVSELNDLGIPFKEMALLIKEHIEVYD